MAKIPVRAPSIADVGYASFTRRLRASVIDAAIVGSGQVVFLFAAEVADSMPGGDRVTWAAYFGLLFLLLLYEPLLVAFRGATVGHSRMNLCVVGPSGGHPNLGIAFARYIIKVVLGLPSFISMAFTSRHQAVHDVLTRTTVQIRDLTLAVPDDYHEQAHRLKATRDRIEAHETPEIAPRPPELAPERPRLAPDQVLALSRLDDQMTALKARGFPIARALSVYNTQRDAILRGELTSSDIGGPD